MRGFVTCAVVLLLVGLVAQPALGQAERQTFEAEIPSSDLLFPTCLGETLSCEGSRLITVQLLETPSGRVNFVNHVRDLGTTCVGNDSGVVYRVSEYQTEVAEFTCDVDGCFDVATFGARYISEGSADNLILRGRVKLLITPSGSLNILEVNTSVECPG